MSTMGNVRRQIIEKFRDADFTSKDLKIAINELFNLVKLGEIRVVRKIGNRNVYHNINCEKSYYKRHDTDAELAVKVKEYYETTT